MGVYIKGMEMPKNCGICPFCVPEADEDRGDICVLCGQFPLVKDEKSCECPLVPVPEHGRLIDADALEKDIDKYIGGEESRSRFHHWVQVQRTVIPESEEART